MKSNKVIILDTARKIKDKPVTLWCVYQNFRWGLTKYENYSLYNSLFFIIESLFFKWPKFSGNRYFPIKGGSMAFETRNLWSGEYGKLRMELLDFMIEELEKEIK